MKKALRTIALITVCIFLGGSIGWWANSPSYDFLCSRPYVAELTKDIEAEGIAIQAGTLVNLRSCEYAERFTISLYYPKYPEGPIFQPVNSAANFGNHGAEQYPVLPAELNLQ